MTDVVKTLRKTGTNTGITRASNVVTVTLTTASTPNIKVGDTVVIAGSTGANDTFNGTHTVIGVTSTTVYTFSQIGADESSTLHGTSGGDYETMSAWQAGETAKDLVTNSVNHYLDCYDDFGTGLIDTCTVSGWTSSATYYVTIRAAAGHGHGGTRGEGFRLRGSITQAGVLQIASSYARVEGIEVENYGGTQAGNQAAVKTTGGYWARFRNCHFFNNPSANTSYGLLIYLGGGTPHNHEAWNCKAYDAHYGFYVNDSWQLRLTARNCAVFDCSFGFGTSSSSNKGFRAINCLSFDNSTDYGNPTSFVSTSKNNAGEAASNIPGTLPQYSLTTTDFVDSANGDYRPTATSTKLVGTGSDQSSVFTDDITGTTRTVPWDIGPFIAAAADTGFSITDVDLDDTIVDEQTGVIVAISGTVAGSGKKVFISQGANWVEQTVTAEDSSSATITVTYGGVLSAGAATLYVRNPL